MTPVLLAILAAGVALMVAGLFVGFGSVSINGLGCGRPFAYSLDVADQNAAAVIRGIDIDSMTTEEFLNLDLDRIGAQGFQFIAQCDDKLGQRRLIAWPLIIGGALFGGAAVFSSRQRPS